MGKGKERRLKERDETKNYPNYCELCEKGLNNPSGFNAHKKIHDSDKCVVCPRCLKLTCKVKLLEKHGEEKCDEVNTVKARKATKKEKKMRKMEYPGGYIV